MQGLFSFRINNLYHAFSVLHILRPIFIFPAEERGKRHDDGHDPDEGDQHPDGGGVPGVDVVRISDCPVPEGKQDDVTSCVRMIIYVNTTRQYYKGS